jgi:phosphoribosyl-ATP pyrophosphohydrolase/phosphoribosyl-AMP cyclohydrolase
MTGSGAGVDDAVAFDERGLVPCVIQDFRTGEVLTLAYMNAESLRLTLATGEVHLYSRSRREIWHKGATSGNVQTVRQLRLDCDGDAVVALVDPAGPACHTGERSCFHRTVDGGARPDPALHEVPAALERTIVDRARARPEGSYTAELLADPARARAKVIEEADEVVRASAEESDGRLAEEAADLVYHLMVVLASRGVPGAAVLETLHARRR